MSHLSPPSPYRQAKEAADLAAAEQRREEEEREAARQRDAEALERLMAQVYML